MDNERPGLVCMRRRCLTALADDAGLVLCAVWKCVCMCVLYGCVEKILQWRTSCLRIPC